MYFNRVMGRTGGMPFKGNGTMGQDKVPSQYQINLAEPGIKSVGVLRGASASSAPIIAVNKARYDNRQPSKLYDTKTSSDNMVYFLDFRDALKQISGSDESNYNPTTSLISLKPKSKPVPTHSTPVHKSMPLFIQACIDTNYGKDNALYDNTSKTLKFSTPANGRLVPERNDLFGMLMDDLMRIENGQFPVHEEWFDSFGLKMTPSKAHKLISILDRVSRLIGFMSENNTWLGKGSIHLRSIMNALLTKNLLDPATYEKQKYFSFFYHINEQAYDDNQGRAIRGEQKPEPLQNATLPTLPFPSPYIQDILLSYKQEEEAALKDLLANNELAVQMLTVAIQRGFSELPFSEDIYGNMEDLDLITRVRGSEELTRAFRASKLATLTQDHQDVLNTREDIQLQRDMNRVLLDNAFGRNHEQIYPNREQSLEQNRREAAYQASINPPSFTVTNPRGLNLEEYKRSSLQNPPVRHDNRRSKYPSAPVRLARNLRSAGASALGAILSTATGTPGTSTSPSTSSSRPPTTPSSVRTPTTIVTNSPMTPPTSQSIQMSQPQRGTPSTPGVVANLFEP